MEDKWYGQYCDSEDVCPGCLDESVDYMFNTHDTVTIKNLEDIDSRHPDVVDVLDICEFCRNIRDEVVDYLTVFNYLVANASRALETTKSSIGYQQSLHHYQVESYDPTTSVELQFQSSPPNFPDSTYIEYTRFESGVLVTHSELPFEFIYSESDAIPESELIPHLDDHNWKVNHTPNSLIYAL